MLLSADDRERIQQAVREAEGSSRAEIVCVISDEASDYSEVPLVWASGLALAAPLLPLTIFAFIQRVREAFMGWIVSPEVSAAAPANALATYAMIQCGAFLVIAILVSIPRVRRALTPHGLKQHFVRQRALEQFIGKGLANTSERTGILLYVSTSDKCVELIADQGIDAKVAPATWKGVMQNLVAEVKRGRAADGLIAAIQACARELARHFPPSRDNPNELPDAVTELPTHTRPY